MKKSDRAIAVSVLTEILDKGAYANIALRKALAESEASRQARAFVTELVNETLRNLILIDHIIETFSSSVTEMKPFIRNVLRISVCQIRFIERIPERAAVNEAVLLTKAYGLERLSGFVNGILRSIAREPEKPAVAPKDLALRYSYPPWLINSLVKWLGSKGAIEFCENSHIPAPVTVLTKENKFETLHHAGDITQLDGFKRGDFIVADPGIADAVDALEAKPGQRIIDVCAAPGGKSFAAAFRMNDTGEILAHDIYPHRIELIKQTQKRLGLSSIFAGIRDATVFDPSLKETADAVLVDAPCSGLGTIRRHPEIKFTRQPEDIPILAKKQSQILANASKYLKSNGILVYCTCTVATEENEEIINAFIESNKNFTLEFARQTLPGAVSDGFFTAKLRKI